MVERAGTQPRTDNNQVARTWNCRYSFTRGSRRSASGQNETKLDEMRNREAKGFQRVSEF